MSTVPPQDVRLAGSRLGVLSAAVLAPARPAVVDRGEVIRYGDLEDPVRRAMGGLLAAGVAPGDTQARVAFVATARRETLVLLHALIELGVPAVPLHPKLTASERHAAVQALSPALVLEAGEVPRGEAWYGPPLSHSPEAPLALVQTSGTTGTPKWAVLSRRAFVAAADASADNLGWRDDDRWLLCMPPAHVGGLSIPIRTLLAQRAVVLAPEGPFDPEATAEVLARDGVTLVSWVPTMLARMLEDPAWTPPPSLRAALVGGAAAPAELLLRAEERGVAVLTTYGLTETCGQVTTQRYGTRHGGERGAGKPLAGIEVEVADDAEIRVRGPTLLDGWLGGGTPVDAHGWLHTGDLGRYDGQGRLHVIGRADERIVTGGENVDPLEVEQALLEQPGVAQACVVGVEEPTWGTVVAAAIVGDGRRDPLAGLEQTLAGRLASHKRPRRIAILDALPTTPSGKPDRRGLARLLAARVSSHPQPA